MTATQRAFSDRGMLMFKLARFVVCFMVLAYGLMLGGISPSQLIIGVKSSVLCYSLLMMVSAYLVWGVLGEVLITRRRVNYGKYFSSDIYRPLCVIAACATILPLADGPSLLQLVAVQIIRCSAMFL